MRLRPPRHRSDALRPRSRLPRIRTRSIQDERRVDRTRGKGVALTAPTHANNPRSHPGARFENMRSTARGLPPYTAEWPAACDTRSISCNQLVSRPAVLYCACCSSMTVEEAWVLSSGAGGMERSYCQILVPNFNMHFYTMIIPAAAHKKCVSINARRSLSCGVRVMRTDRLCCNQWINTNDKPGLCARSVRISSLNERSPT